VSLNFAANVAWRPLPEDGVREDRLTAGAVDVGTVQVPAACHPLSVEPPVAEAQIFLEPAKLDANVKATLMVKFVPDDATIEVAAARLQRLFDKVVAAPGAAPADQPDPALSTR
jgi:hypothetical protein